MDSIHIQGYKSIKDATIELKPINILIGGNGSGKSNFLSFFEFLNKIYSRNLKEYVALKGIEKFLHKGRITTKEITGHVVFNVIQQENSCEYYKVKLKAGDRHFTIADENWGFFDKSIGAFNFTSTAIPIPLFEEESSISLTQSKYFKEYLEGVKKYHFHDTGRNSPFNRTNNIQNDSYYLYEDGGNIAAMLLSIRDKHPLTYTRIVSVIQSIAPYFLDFYFEPNENNLMHLQWRDKYSSIMYGATDLSDGTIRFIALTVLFLQPKLPATIIIDEPELGLHPSAIGMLAGLMQSAAAQGAQIIAATQSAELIDHFGPNDVIAVDLINGESKFSRLDNDELSNWLINYSLGDLWKQNIINRAQP
jgi:predicted ATPase